MKTIIVPLDFSNESLTGLNLSLMLAAKTKAKIQMVHVIRKNESTNDENLKKEHQLAELKFDEILKKYKEKNKLKIEVSYTIKEGSIFKEIAALGDSYEDALIVLSTHGESGFEELFIGGNAYKITSHSRSPVITVRRSKISLNIDRIVLPLDTTFQTREKVPYTAKLAKIFNSEIYLLSVQLTKLKRIEKKLHRHTAQVAAYLEKHEIPYKIEHLQGDNLTDITLEYARSVNADLISIMTEQEKSISNLLLGSYAHQMINKAFIPVLSFPNYHLQIATDDVWDLGAFNG
jgi:nucleotide-binding universal stress UspA family protein